MEAGLAFARRQQHQHHINGGVLSRSSVHLYCKLNEIKPWVSAVVVGNVVDDVVDDVGRILESPGPHCLQFLHKYHAVRL